MSKQPDSDMFARELHLAGERVSPGLYKQVDSSRVVELDLKGLLPASLDGQAAVCACARRSRNQGQEAYGVSSAHSVEGMPDTPFCEVIGCGEEVCWVLVLSQDVHSADCLCNHHHKLLHSQDSNRASRYTHLSRQLKEGVGG